MVTFDILDYTENGEFIYYYITPAWIEESEILAFSNDPAKSSGTVSRNGFVEPDRSKGYSYRDAEILMAYNPDTGDYRVIHAASHRVEWNPKQVKRPDFYSGMNSDVVMKSLGFSCKVPGRHQYMIFSRYGVAYVYDDTGGIVMEQNISEWIKQWAQNMKNRLSSGEGQPSIPEEAEDDEDSTEELSSWRSRNHRSAPEDKPDLKRFMIESVAIGSEYNVYVYGAGFTGSSLQAPESKSIRALYMAYYEDFSKSSYVSVNKNAEEQISDWLSISGNHYESEDEMQSDPNMSIDSIKSSGAHKDSFTPFVLQGSHEEAPENLTYIMGTPDIPSMKLYRPGGAEDFKDMFNLKNYVNPDPDTLPRYWTHAGENWLHFLGAAYLNPIWGGDDGSSLSGFERYLSFPGLAGSPFRNRDRYKVRDLRYPYVYEYSNYSNIRYYVHDLYSSAYEPISVYQYQPIYEKAPRLYYLCYEDFFRLAWATMLFPKYSVASDRDYYLHWDNVMGVSHKDIMNAYYGSHFLTGKNVVKEFVARLIKCTIEDGLKEGKSVKEIMERMAGNDLMPNMGGWSSATKLNEDSISRYPNHTWGDIKGKCKPELYTETSQRGRVDKYNLYTDYHYGSGEKLANPQAYQEVRFKKGSDGSLEVLVAPINTYSKGMSGGNYLSGENYSKYINEPEYDQARIAPLEYMEKAERVIWFRSDKESERQWDSLLRGKFDDAADKSAREIREIIQDDQSGSDREALTAEFLYQLLRQEAAYEDEEDEDVEEGLAEDALNDAAVAAAAAADLEEEKSEDDAERLQELMQDIPEEDREHLLNLCLGYAQRVDTISEDTIPYSYKISFPSGASVGVQMEMAGATEGKISSIDEGLMVLSEMPYSYDRKKSSGTESVNNKRLFSNLNGFTTLSVAASTAYDSSTDKTWKYYDYFRWAYGGDVQLDTSRGRVSKTILQSSFLESSFNPGEPREVAELTYRGEKASEDTKYLAYRTKLGVRFFKAKSKSSGSEIQFEPVSFSSIGDLVYQTLEYRGTSSNDDFSYRDHVEKSQTEGFITNDFLLSSTGYTKDTENRTQESYEELLDDAKEAPGQGGYEGTTDKTREQLERVNNMRAVGSLPSAKAFNLIGPDTALVCSLSGGTRILNLKSGEVIPESSTGSFFQLFQKGRSRDYKLIGFDTDEWNYYDKDYPMAKIYDRNYGEEKVDTTLIDSMKAYLQQMAKDYLYRHYRTRLSEDGEEIVRIPMPSEEAGEDESARKLFDSGLGSASVSLEGGDSVSSDAVKLSDAARAELRRIEKNNGIDDDPKELQDYLLFLRERLYGQRPAVTKAYILAGAWALATSEKREEGYWRNMDARITMAESRDAIKDILVEIRMNSESGAARNAEQAQKYADYRSHLDFTGEQGAVELTPIDMEIVSSNQISANETGVSINSASRIREDYRRDVLNDIMEDFKKNYSDKEDAENVRTDQEFDEIIDSILERANPENLVISKGLMVDEFVERVVNQGEKYLTGELLDQMKERMREAFPEIDSIWKLEKLILSEKVRMPHYAKYLREYQAFDEMDQSATDTERAALVRRSDFYKAVFREIEADPDTAAYLKANKMTLAECEKAVITGAGKGYVKQEDGKVEGARSNDIIDVWRDLENQTVSADSTDTAVNADVAVPGK